MRILITGAGGMLGQDVAEAVRASGHEPVALARRELDVTDPTSVAAAIDSHRPGAVINCAAYTNVDGAEADRADAQLINATAAGHVASAAASAGAFTVHVSTDYVFDGTKRTPYLESDPTAPQSVYGETKLAGEQAVAAAAPGRYTIVRASWLFGLHGPCFPATILRLASDPDRERLSVVDDQLGCPTFTPHLARALVELAAEPTPDTTGVVHVAGGGECTWFQFARAIVAGAAAFDDRGPLAEIEPCTTDAFPRPAPRPGYSVLRTERGAAVPTLPQWEAGLDAYLDARLGTAEATDAAAAARATR